jgi:hypothetical protein
MKNLEIKHIQLGSVVKTLIFASAIPALLALIVFIVQVVVLGSFFAIPNVSNNGVAVAGAYPSATQSGSVLAGLTQILIFALPFTLYPLLIGIAVALFVFSYNLFASKFGGLVIRVSDRDE